MAAVAAVLAKLVELMLNAKVEMELQLQFQEVLRLTRAVAAVATLPVAMPAVELAEAVLDRQQITPQVEMEQ
jgi:hypothetical protein